MIIYYLFTMTKNNFKTILFASLLVAMVLPFSGMNFATAEEETNEKRDRSKDPGSGQGTNKDQNEKTHREQIQEGKVVLPGGHYVYRSELNGLDNDKSIEENAENGFDSDILMTHNGKTIFNLDAYKEKLEASGELSEETNSIVANEAYKMIALKNVENSMAYFNAHWRVPSVPATYDGEGTIFIFNAMQPFPGVIFQPILQYGNYGICGDVGETWVMAPVIFIDPTSFNIGNCTPVNVGDIIRGTISVDSEDIWTVEIQNYNIPDSSDIVQVAYSDLADDSLVAIETYLLPENCDSLPGNIGFVQMDIGGINIPNWVDDSNPELQWCDMDTRIVSEDTVILINKLS